MSQILIKRLFLARASDMSLYDKFTFKLFFPTPMTVYRAATP